MTGAVRCSVAPEPGTWALLGTGLMALGVIGEYLGRLYLEAKQRPLYLVQEWRGGAERDRPPQPV